MQLEAVRPRALMLPRVALSSRAIAALGSCAVGAIALAVYVATLAPTVMWYDMGEFATAASTLGIAHNTGYPLLILLGKGFTSLPIGDPAYRVNLMSAVFTAAPNPVSTPQPMSAAKSSFMRARVGRRPSAM